MSSAVWIHYTNVTYGQTDGHRTTANTALTCKRARIKHFASDFLRPWRYTNLLTYLLSPLLHHQSSVISIDHEVTFPSHDNRNQVVYNSVKLCHVTTWLSSIFGSKRNQASFHSRRKSSRTKDTIKNINTAGIVIHVLSFSFCHYATAEALPDNFQVICSTRTTSYGSRIIGSLFPRPYN